MKTSYSELSSIEFLKYRQSFPSERDLPSFMQSLLSGSVMQFRRGEAGEGSHATPLQSVYLPRRSLLILSGEARLAWQHYIPHR